MRSFRDKQKRNRPIIQAKTGSLASRTASSDQARQTCCPRRSGCRASRLPHDIACIVQRRLANLDCQCLMTKKNVERWSTGDPA